MFPFFKPEYWRLRAIAKKVRSGIVPVGVDTQTIFKALRQTRPPNAVEMFGFLFAKVQNPDGSEKIAERLMAVKEVTAVFAKRLVDAMVTSGDVIDNFQQHKMGSGSTAETDTQTALVAGQAGATSGVQTHGTSSQVYQTLGTITAGASFGCREHGIFNASTGGILLDRSLVTNIDLNTNDIVTWTYNLTINAGG